MDKTELALGVLNALSNKRFNADEIMKGSAEREAIDAMQSLFVKACKYLEQEIEPYIIDIKSLGDGD